MYCRKTCVSIPVCNVVSEICPGKANKNNSSTKLNPTLAHFFFQTCKFWLVLYFFFQRGFFQRLLLYPWSFHLGSNWDLPLSIEVVFSKTFLFSNIFWTIIPMSAIILSPEWNIFNSNFKIRSLDNLTFANRTHLHLILKTLNLLEYTLFTLRVLKKVYSLTR